VSKLKLKNATLITEAGAIKSDLVIDNTRLRLGGQSIDCERTIDLAGKYIVPGFVDIHFHGLGLFDFTMGRYNPDEDVFDDTAKAFDAGFRATSKALVRHGVTSYYIATFAAPIDTLKKCFGYLADYMLSSEQTEGAKLLGGLLEGSFINPQMAGAQNPDFLFECSRNIFDNIEDQNTIKLANVVPDSGDDAIALISYLTKKGIVVGAGHTNATSEQFACAIEAGLKYCIHFTNGPTGSSFKPFNGGGAVEAVLSLDSVYAELIADGYHVNPAYIRDIINRKGSDRIIGVTDCMFIADSDVRQFNIAGVKAQLSDNGKFIYACDKQNTLAGSVLTMDRGFENMLNWLVSNVQGIWIKEHKALSFEQALTNIAKFYSTNPCKLTGLYEHGIGLIADGAQADLCVLDITKIGSAYKVAVDKTIVNGSIVYDKEEL